MMVVRLGTLISSNLSGRLSPAGAVTPESVEGHFNDKAKVKELAMRCDVVTCEIEHINTEALVELEKVIVDYSRLCRAFFSILCASRRRIFVSKASAWHLTL